MKQEILIDSVDKALGFVKVIDRLDANLYFVTESDFINAKSVLGVFSMNLDKPHTLSIEGEKAQELEALAVIQKFVAEN